jgi:hypothetical protein
MHGCMPMSAKHDRNGVAARFLILSRQRSASTTLVRLLNQHAGVTCLLELPSTRAVHCFLFSLRVRAPTASSFGIEFVDVRELVGSPVDVVPLLILYCFRFRLQ